MSELCLQIVAIVSIKNMNEIQCQVLRIGEDTNLTTDTLLKDVNKCFSIIFCIAVKKNDSGLLASF